MSRAKFTSHGPTGVTVEYTDITANLPECRTFIARDQTVFELIGVGGERPTCARLSHTGAALVLGEKDDLMNLIRAEYRKMRRADRRALGD